MCSSGMERENQLVDSHDLRCCDDRTGSMRDYLHGNYCIDAVAVDDDGCDVFQLAVAWLWHGCYDGISVDAAIANCADADWVAMANYDHYEASEMSVAFPLDGGGDGAHDLAKLLTKWAEYE